MDIPKEIFTPPSRSVGVSKENTCYPQARGENQEVEPQPWGWPLRMSFLSIIWPKIWPTCDLAAVLPCEARHISEPLTFSTETSGKNSLSWCENYFETFRQQVTLNTNYKYNILSPKPNGQPLPAEPQSQVHSSPSKCGQQGQAAGGLDYIGL